MWRLFLSKECSVQTQTERRSSTAATPANRKTNKIWSLRGELKEEMKVGRERDRGVIKCFTSRPSVELKGWGDVWRTKIQEY